MRFKHWDGDVHSAVFICLFMAFSYVFSLPLGGVWSGERCRLVWSSLAGPVLNVFVVLFFMLFCNLGMIMN